jgi:AcrR family transcriptional regulator
MASKENRREREVSRIREEILWAFARASLNKKTGDVTVQDIAHEAGYSAPTLYAYFKIKEEIREELRARLNQEVLASFSAPEPEGLTFRQRLELLMHRLVELSERRREALIFFMMSRAAETAEQDRQGFTLVYDAMTNWFRRAGSSKATRFSPEDLATAFLGIGQTTFLRWAMSDQTVPLAKATKATLDIFLNGALGAAANERR